MKIGIIGAGNIGRTLGKKWINAKHEVMFGVRNADEPKNDGLSRVSVAEAIAFGEVILFSIPSQAMPIVMQVHGEALNGKIVIDATNKMRDPVVNNIAVIQQVAPQAKIYRAFNSLGWENFENPTINDEQVDLLFCGADNENRSVIEGLITDIGLHSIYVGDLDKAPLVDALGVLWMNLAFGQRMGRRLTFKILHEPSE